MITVRVIFLGLIGFVPSPQGFKDMAALLVDPVQMEGHEMVCPAEPHVPFVFLLHGKCRSGKQCIRVGGPRAETVADEAGLLAALERRGPESLLWVPRHEDLEVSGDEDEKLDLSHRFFSFLHMASPGSRRQASYFSWVPNMERLAKGHDQIRADCRRGDPTCPLSARFRIDGGEMGACHLFHDPEESQETERDVRIFTYMTPDQHKFRQAVADAVMVEFKESQPYVTLRSQGLPGRGRPRVSVRLYPDYDRKLTLVVGNIVLPYSEKLRARQDSYEPPHSDVLFNLLADAVAPPVRLPYSTVRRVDPGACEAEMEELEELLVRPDEVPHAVTACDGISFPKPK